MADNVTAQAANTETGAEAEPLTGSSGVIDSSANSAALQTLPMSSEATAESVEALPEWAKKLVSELRKENANHRKAKTEAEKAAEEAARQAAEQQGRYKELYEAQLQKAQEAETRAKAAELAGLRSKVGSKYGLPEVLRDRLQGETEEALEADAKALAASLPKAPVATDAGAGVNSNAPRPGLSDDQLREMAAVYGVSFEHLKNQVK